MDQATHSDENSVSLASHISRGLREGALIVFGATAIYLVASLVTYHPADPGWSHSESVEKVLNVGGRAGAWFSDLFLYLFGFLAYLFPIMVAYSGWLLFKGRRQSSGIGFYQIVFRAVGFLLTLCGGTGLATLHFNEAISPLPLDAGGILGDIVGHNLVNEFNFLGATLFLLALFLVGVTLFTDLSWFRLMDSVGRMTLNVFAKFKELNLRFAEYREGRRARSEREEVVRVDQEKKKKRTPPRIEPVVNKPKQSDRELRERQVPLVFEPTEAMGDLPPLALLDPAEPPKNIVSSEALEAMSRQVELKLQDFGIEAEVVAVHPGPVITRYEIFPAPGVKVSQITNLSKDLARSLSVISVRVVEIIAGRSTIGLEIPNEQREIVKLSEVLKSSEYEKAKSSLTLALGKNINGQPVVTDLGRMPHLLVAGTTGSGKSVAINAMVLSLL